MTDMDLDWLAVDAKGNTQLHHAAERGDVATCAEIIARSHGRMPVDARNNSGLSPLHMAACNGQVETARWLLDHGADLNAVTASDYEYLWSGATEGYGMERTIPARSTAMSIALAHHKQTKWVLGKPRQLVELLEERGAKRPLSSSRRLARFLLALPLMLLTMLLAFWGLLHVDGSMTGWKTLAEKYPASRFPPSQITATFPPTPPSVIETHQDGGLGTIGLVRLRHMLRAAATDDGLYLAFPGLLGAGHAPLLIPWDKLSIQSEQTLLGIYVLTLAADAGADADPFQAVPRRFSPHHASRRHRAAGEGPVGGRWTMSRCCHEHTVCSWRVQRARGKAAARTWRLGVHSWLSIRTESGTDSAPRPGHPRQSGQPASR